MSQDQGEQLGTKEHILDTAEKLFAEEGFERVSLRKITAAAHTNLASVNYHFGSKEGLIVSVLSRYIEPINRERLRLLDEAESLREGQPVPVREVLKALFLPVISMMQQSEHSQPVFCKLLGRCLNEGNVQLTEQVAHLFHQVAQRFIHATKRALPHLTEKQVYWRMHFSVGILIHTFLRSDLLMAVSGGRSGPLDPDQVMEWMIDYAEAGLNQGNN